MGLPVLLGAAMLSRRTPLGAACGVMFVAGGLWGGAALRARSASCAGRWTVGTRAAVVRLRDPAPAAGGIVTGDVQAGSCRGSLTLRWPAGRPARGGTAWVV